MIELLQFKISTRKNKKYMLLFNIDGKAKTIHFGSAVSQTYIDHLDDIKKENYIARHRPNENWDKINPASSSRYILWSKKTLKKSLKSFMKRFNIKDSRNTN